MPSPYTIQRLDKHPAILVIYHEDFEIPRDYLPCVSETIAQLNKELAPITVITDIRACNISFDDVMSGTKVLTTPENNLTRHRNATKNIVIASSRMFELSVDGLQKIGLVHDVKIVDSVEKALASI